MNEEHGGSIADRLKALRGHGLDVSSGSKRVSQDLGHPSTAGPRPSGAASTAAHSIAPRHEPEHPTHTQPTRQSTLPQPPSRPTSRAAGPRPPSSPSVQKTHIDAAPLATVHTTGSSSTQVDGASSKSPITSAGILPQASTSAITSPTGETAKLPKPATPPQPQENGSEAGAIDRFSAAFPSLDELGKQFDDEDLTLPTPPVNGIHSKRAPLPVPPNEPPVHKDAAEFLSFPNLPSVPTSLPGQRKNSISSGRPSRPDDLELGGGPPSPPHLDSEMDAPPSPPKPDFSQNPNRPASTLGFTEQSRPLSTHADDADLERRFALLSARSRRADKSDHAPSTSPPVSAFSTSTMSTTSTFGNSPLPTSGSDGATVATSPTVESVPASPAIAFPVPSLGAAKAVDPTPSHPAQRTENSHAEKDALKKPDFPLTNSIVPNALREYLLNPAVDVLLLDVRPEEEFLKGFVGAEYHERRHINIVWLDPQVLMRPK